jgi:hypothetical protein
MTGAVIDSFLVAFSSPVWSQKKKKKKKTPIFKF